MQRLVIASGLVAAASTLDPVLMTPGCNCGPEWFRPADALAYVPALAIALVAGIRFLLDRTPGPSPLPVAVAGHGRWRAALFAFRVRCAASCGLRLLLGLVSITATINVSLMVLYATSDDVGDHAPFLLSHLVMIFALIARSVTRGAHVAS